MRLPRASGILLHPTSLPGPHGSGDFGASARHFVDWLVTAGQALWQILPLGGIGPGNSPYMSCSAFGGNPLLIDLTALHEQGWLTADDLVVPHGFEVQRVAFDHVVPWRMSRLMRAAARFAHHGTAEQRADFAAFCEAASHWLDDDALYLALVDEQAPKQWCDWPSALVHREPAALAQARERLAGAIGFHKFCQWCFDRQWHALKSYANERGVRIFGDAPIFVAHDSADVWSHQHLFELDDRGHARVVAGVPPDAFSETGQHWGNPLYRWPAHAADGYAWWIARIRRAFDLVDLVRIDHFRGFAAYWEIPGGDTNALGGRWVPGPGAALFDALAKAIGPMPIVAEDLGVITPDVVALRKRFAFPGMRVLQFAFGGGSDNLYLPHNHEHDSVVYTGTHDNDTTVGWWQHAGDAERAHVHEYLRLGAHHRIHDELVRTSFASVADTAIHPMQDVLGLDSRHRMNHPGRPEGFWAWRFEWNQVHPEHAERLAHWCRLYRRDGTTLK